MSCARSRTAAIVLAAAIAAAAGCRDDARARLRATTHATFDHKTGKLTELTFDANRDGRIDTWTQMDGTRPVMSRVDRDQDGIVDRWEYYDGQGRLEKVGFSRARRDTPDAWAFAAGAGRLERIEASSKGDPAQIDRLERYATSGPVDANGLGALLSVEEDSDGDGKVDRWETYEAGEIRTLEVDENHDGIRDRRLTYKNSTVVLVESEPDAAGQYTRRVDVTP
jgi:hypothetical protein